MSEIAKFQRNFDNCQLVKRLGLVTEWADDRRGETNWDGKAETFCGDYPNVLLSNMVLHDMRKYVLLFCELQPKLDNGDPQPLIVYWKWTC